MWLTLFLTYALAQTALADTAFTQQLCTTGLGAQSASVIPSTTQTLAITLKVTTKVCPTPFTATVTPTPTTTIVTATAFSTITQTAPQQTNVVVITNINTITNTQTTVTGTITTVTTTTATTTTLTSTVPTPAGFKPVVSAPGYVPKEKRGIPGRLAPRAQQAVVTKAVIKNHAKVYSPPAYPTKVNCVKFVQSLVTQTVTRTDCPKVTTTTTLPVRTVTSTSTTTSTTTTTQVPVPATVMSMTSTSTITTTTTTITTTDVVSSTVTNTVTAPTATYYAACASNNIVNKANGGNYIVGLYYNPASATSNFNQVTYVTATSAYDCCAACQATANCIWSDYYGGECENIIAPSCQPGNNFNSYFSTSSGFDYGFAISNGPCGYVGNAGNEQ